MTLMPVPTSGRSKVTSSIVVTMNLEFNSTCRRKIHSPIPLKYLDVTRSTHTDLDVLQDKRIDDLAECRFEWTLVRFAERIHNIHSVEGETSKKIYVVPGETDKKAAG